METNYLIITFSFIFLYNYFSFNINNSVKLFIYFVLYRQIHVSILSNNLLQLIFDWNLK